MSAPNSPKMDKSFVTGMYSRIAECQGKTIGEKTMPNPVPVNPKSNSRDGVQNQKRQTWSNSDKMYDFWREQGSHL